MKIVSTPVPNRVVAHASPPLVVPETAEARQSQYSRTLAAAVAFLESRITSGDVEAAERAVAMLFDLEKTRLRHAREIHGVPETKAKPTTTMLPPMEVAAPPSTSDQKPTFSRDAESSERSASRQRDNKERDQFDDAALRSEDSASRLNSLGDKAIGPQSGASHARTRSILLRRLAEAEPGRVWSDDEVDRMLAQLETLHREQTDPTQR